MERGRQSGYTLNFLSADTILWTVRVTAWAALLGGWAWMGLVDWSEQKIRNRFLVLWAALTAFLYAPLLVQTALGLSGRGTGWLLPAWWIDLFVHLAVTFGAAVALWCLRVWPAGDVKLFCLLAALTALTRLPQGFHGGTLFLETLINIFLPAAAFLFVTAAAYLWRTRFAHQAAFLRELGVRRVLPFLKSKLDEAAAEIGRERDNWVNAYKGNPGRLALDASLFFLSMAAMSLVSYFIGEKLGSPVIKTLVTFGMFMMWSKFANAIGKPNALALVIVFFGAAILRTGTPDWAALAIAFGHISVFSFAIFFGIQMAFKIVAGQVAYTLMPFIFLIPMLIPFHVMRTWIASKLDVALPALPGDGGLFMWAGMGLFFGLSLVFVRIWDEESYLSLAPDQIKPRMTIGPKLVALLEQDEDFVDEFGAFYADGLTPDQVDLLRKWCADNGVTAIPLAPTISFANWVYLGYFITIVLDGHVLRWLY